MTKRFITLLAGMQLILIACGCSMAPQRSVSHLTVPEYLHQISREGVECHADLCLMAGGMRVDSSERIVVDLLLVGRHSEFEDMAKVISLDANAFPGEVFGLLKYDHEAGAEIVEFTAVGSRRPQRQGEYILYQPTPTVRSHMIVPMDEGRQMALIPVSIQLADHDPVGDGWAIQLKEDVLDGLFTRNTYSVDTSVTNVEIRCVEIVAK